MFFFWSTPTHATMSLALEEIHHQSANKNKNDDAYQSIIVNDMWSLVIIEMRRGFEAFEAKCTYIFSYCVCGAPVRQMTSLIIL